NINSNVNNNNNNNNNDNSNNKNKNNDDVNKPNNNKHHSKEKPAQIHREEIASFRRRVGIRLSHDNRHDVSIPDPISSFRDWKCPLWWRASDSASASASADKEKEKNGRTETFHRLHRTLLANIERGKWVEPTPIQMQSLPSLVERRDVMGCAPTGSGKTGAFVLPALMLAKCPEDVFYGTFEERKDGGKRTSETLRNPPSKSSSSSPSSEDDDRRPTLQGHVRVILLAPSRELASQLHREVLRLSANVPGKLHSVLLSKSNAGLASSNRLGGNHGLDVLVSTPLRLVECIERGMRLNGVRLIVLDEADRLLDASDGGRRNARGKNENDHESDHNDDDGNGNRVETKMKTRAKTTETSNGADDSTGDEGGEEDDGSDNSDSGDDDDDNRNDNHDHPSTKHNRSNPPPTAPGTSQGSRTFLRQIDSILATLPPTATRALFSATLGPSVRHLSESILRSPVDISTGSTANGSAAAVASDTIHQELKFVGREEGKLLAIRQMIREGISPPILIFLQSQERAQALFAELLYDGMRADVIHAGRSPSAREASVAKFRRGETWMLICTDLVARGVDFKAVNLVINYDMPADGVTYVHRIGRTGRAGREGRAITFFTEGDFENLRTVANVMRLSGCEVPEWMLSMKVRGGGGGGIGGNKRRKRKNLAAPKRPDIDTTPLYDKKKRQRRQELINNSKRKKAMENENNS
ncbi:hypothetical protein ACHAXS_007537, partial [Conticribra weissflogii]